MLNYQRVFPVLPRCLLLKIQSFLHAWEEVWLSPGNKSWLASAIIKRGWLQPFPEPKEVLNATIIYKQAIFPCRVRLLEGITDDHWEHLCVFQFNCFLRFFFQDVFSMLPPKTVWDGMSAFCFDWYPVVVPLFFPRWFFQLIVFSPIHCTRQQGETFNTWKRKKTGYSSGDSGVVKCPMTWIYWTSPYSSHQKDN